MSTVGASIVWQRLRDSKTQILEEESGFREEEREGSGGGLVCDNDICDGDGWWLTADDSGGDTREGGILFFLWIEKETKENKVMV